jgi:PAS domain S-box-containing protein
MKSDRPAPNVLPLTGQRAGRRISPRPQYITAAVVVCLGVAASVAAMVAMRSWEHERMTLDFARAATDRTAAMAHNLAIHDYISASLNSLFRTGVPISRSDFVKYTSPLLASEPSLQALTWIPRVRKADRAAYEALATQETGQEFHFTERTAKGMVVRPECEEYYPVYYNVPYEDPLPVMGLDVASDPQRRQALEAACDTGQAVAAGPVELMWTAGQDRIGYLIYRPVYEKGVTPDTVEERRALLKGFTQGVFRIALSLKAAVSRLETAGVDIYISDNTVPEDPRFVCFVPSRSRKTPLTLEEYLKRDPQAGLRQVGVLKLTGGKTWAMTCTPTPAFVATRMTWQPWGGLGAGLLLTLTLALYLLNTARYIARTGRLMDSLRTNENKYRALYDNVSVGVALIGPNMEILALNRRMREWFPQVDLEQHPLCYRAFNTPPRNDCCTYCPTRQTLQDGRVHEAVTETPTPDGVRHYRIVSTPLTDADGKVTSAIEMVDDITDRKRAEEAIRQAKAEAEHANAAKSAFLANMSHEIRTPMTAIMGFTDLLGQSLDECADIGCPAGHNPAVRREYLKTVQRNGEHLLGLVNDILDLSKIEAGKMRLERTSCSPVQIVEEVVSLIRVSAIGKGLTLDGRYEFPIPETILSDPVRVRQVLVNLAGNAVKFTASGGVEIRVRYEAASEASRALLKFEIRDTGIGLTPEEIGRLFQPFAQADSSTTRQFGGTGLGLSICKRLAEALGGDIHVDSTPGQGSTFTFTLGAEAPAPVRMLDNLSEAAQASSRPPLAAPANIALCGKVLLAEDGPDNQVLISTILRNAGAVVDVASNGRVAVEKVLAAMAAGTPYRAVLMDMQMPEVDGYEAASQLRHAGYTGPIVALTAHAMAEDRQKCLDAGCDDYATKPVDRPGLLLTLARLMGCPPPAPDEPSAAPAAAPTLSDEPILSTFRNDPDMADITAGFVRHLPERLAEMRQAAEAGRWEVLRRLAHQVKGAGGSYGYLCLTEAAREVESHANPEDAERARMALANLARLCERVRAGLAMKPEPQTVRVP